ncbi:hypothetical protein DFO66_10718 [Brevibacterium sanguinis]|uniref:Uncharacterized protein n=2 Tax=Brevibacterium TaxID=1696 RepID=A0A366II83_9MICO|nr:MULTISPECIES: hypothetical protein [Brevibacterium]RBP64146.1 hypothetical protein DFO66_10718 [Brevibacterium sanguinis]RBP71562.1 hypothetical protein DFO65_105166 [Brevibacterium celere]
MTLRDNYLDALALVQAQANDDHKAIEAIVHNADPVGLIAALVDIILGTGSSATGTPGDPTRFLVQLREQIENHPRITDE